MTTETTILKVDSSASLKEQTTLLEGRLGALRGMREDFLSERDKRNGYSWQDVEAKTLHRINFNIAQILELETSGIEREIYYQKYKKIKQEIKQMEEQKNDPQGVGTTTNGNTPGGGDDADMKRHMFKSKAVDSINEIRDARATLQSQFDEIKTQAKSKLQALKKAEDALLELSKPTTQEELFSIDPELSPEARSIISNPIL